MTNRGRIWAIIIIASVLIIIGLICYFNMAEDVETITKGTLI